MSSRRSPTVITKTGNIICGDPRSVSAERGIQEASNPFKILSATNHECEKISNFQSSISQESGSINLHSTIYYVEAKMHRENIGRRCIETSRDAQ